MAGQGGRLVQLVGVVDPGAEVLHPQPAVAIEAAGRGVQPDGAAGAGTDGVGRRPVGVAADGDDAGDRRNVAHDPGDVEDRGEVEVVQAGGDVPVQAGVGLQVVVDERGVVDDEDGAVVERPHPVPAGPQRRRHHVDPVGQPAQDDVGHVGAHERLVAGEGVRAGVAQPGPGAGRPQQRHRRGEDVAQVRPQCRQPQPGQVRHPQRAAPLAHRPGGDGAKGVRRGVGRPDGGRVGHRAGAEAVEDEDGGRPAHATRLPSASNTPSSRGRPEPIPATTATRERVTKICVRNAMTAVSPTRAPSPPPVQSNRR